MVKNLLIDVDTQYDFMDPKGSLYVPGAADIVGNMKTAISSLIKAGSFAIVSTVDMHDEDDEEFKTYPPHCVKGTAGADKIAETMVYREPYLTRIIGVDDVYNKHNCCQFVVSKKTYDIWDVEKGNPAVMRSMISFLNPTNIFIMGVATDVCVIALAKGLVRDRSIYFIDDCCKGLTDIGDESSKWKMCKMGFKSIMSSEVQIVANKKEELDF